MPYRFGGGAFFILPVLAMGAGLPCDAAQHMEVILSKRGIPFFEEKPYYMTAMGMLGARFVEGNDGTGGEGEKPSAEGKPTGDEGKPAEEGGKPTDDEGKLAAGKADGDGDGDEELGEGGKRALESERTARKQAEKDVAERDATITAKNAEIEELTKKATGSDATLAAKDAEISVLKLALETGLRNEDDLALLASVSDEAKRKALAERLSEKGPTSSPVNESGTSDDEDRNPSGGSVAAGREMFQKSKKTKKVGA